MTPIDLPCPVCGANPGEPCREDGEDLPKRETHIGRLTQGAPLTILRRRGEPWTEVVN